MAPDALGLVAVRDLVVGHEGRGLLPPVNLEIAAGEIWAVVGPNGSGKSTFLRTVLGLLPAVSGTVRSSAACRPCYVPQHAALDPVFPVRVLEFVLTARLAPGKLVTPYAPSDVARARASLEAVGALEHSDRLIRDLSGGQRQRVLIARALSSDATLYVLDEPTAALDLPAERAVLDLVERLRTPTSAVVMVTHLVEDAIRRADRALLLDRDHGAALTARASDLPRTPEFVHIYGTHLEAAGPGRRVQP